MTLIIGVSYRDQFVIASNDSKITSSLYDPKTFEKLSNEVHQTDMKSEKVQLLTDSVLICDSGIVATCDVVQKVLSKRIESHYTLNQCANILHHVILDLKNEAVTGLNEREQLSVPFLKTKYYSCYLIGFTDNGRTGIARYNPFESKVEQTESPMSGGYPVFLNSPSEEDLKYQAYLNVPEEERNFEGFVNRFLWIHANLCGIHKEQISQDCNFTFLINNQGEKPKHVKRSFNTVEFPLT
jgi:hypothetical protein